MKTSIARFGSMSMDLLFGTLRWSMLLAPVALAFAPPVHAAAATIDYEQIDIDDGDALSAPQISEKGTEFGPFRLAAPDRVEMIGGVSSETPARFKALLSAYPHIRQIDFVECPGSEDDDANLEIARTIREHRIATNIPAGGSIRSGGVELFLAGIERTAAKSAEIGVHSWQDSDGLEATDYPPDDDVHKPYLSFYHDMGMSTEQARDFYDFTNSAAPFNDVHYLNESEIKRFGLTTGA